MHSGKYFPQMDVNRKWHDSQIEIRYKLETINCRSVITKYCKPKFRNRRQFIMLKSNTILKKIYS
jgi:hypothetical protein